MQKGVKINELTLLEPFIKEGKNGRKFKAWMCLCDCGNMTEVIETNLRSGHTRTCGKHRRKGTIQEEEGRYASKCLNLGYKLIHFGGTGKLRSSVLCLSCGTRSETRLDNLLSGYKPCKCSKTARLTREDVMKEISVLLQTDGIADINLIEFKGIRSKIDVKFGCGCNKNYTLQNFKKGTRRCFCRIGSTPVTPGDIVSRVLEGHIVCLEPVTTHSKLKFLCCKHNKIYRKTIYSHTKSSGCSECSSEFLSKARKGSIEDVIRDLERLGTGYKYLYDTYSGRSNKLEIVCDRGHRFSQTVTKHLRGSRCPECATYGFKSGKEAILYVVELRGNNWSYLKFGITNRSIDERMEQICRKSSSQYTVLYKYTDEGKYCRDIEDKLKSLFKNQRACKDLIPDGYSETCANTSENIEIIFSVLKEAEEKKYERV